MVSPYITPALWVAVTLLYILRRWLQANNEHGTPRPPGPKPLPIIGNLLDIPKAKLAQTFGIWSKTYGDVVYLSVLGKSMVILNSHAAAVDLLEKRSSIYSDRPRLAFAGELVGWNKSVALSHYNPRHREMRKQLYSVIGGRNADQFNELQERETERFLTKLLKDPENFIRHSRWLAGSIILRITYGYDVAEEDDPNIETANRVMGDFVEATMPGAWLVDFLPALRHLPTWFPGVSFHRDAKRYRESGKEMIDYPYEEAKARQSSLFGDPCYVTKALALDRPPTIEEEDITMWSAAALYGGGADTTVSALSTFFLAMSMNLPMQELAQNEIDQLLKNEAEETRLPSFQDQMKLPYVNALIKEVLRWGCVAPTGIPHRLIQDDCYNGWTIPQGSLVISNLWAICHDPSTYPNPHLFNPNRYMPPNNQLDPRSVVFGYGRRVCPGISIAEKTLFITIVRILSVFHITPTTEGVSSTCPEYTDGTISHPKVFRCHINRRPGLAERTISP